jgi:cytochrome c551/c552
MNNPIKKHIGHLLLTAAVLAGINLPLLGQESPMEEDYFKIMKVSSPEGTLLEVGGLVVLPNGNLGISTRRGDVFMVENPTSPRPFFRKFASGLHEILGLTYKDGHLYCAQRGELTKLIDSDMDGEADIYETVHAWPVSGHYHEYSYGPVIAPDGKFFVSGNVAFGNEEWWRGESRVPYRGWIMKISEDGQVEPWATGMRSPAGIGIIDGELFYTDNQGDYIGSGGLWHIRKGDFTGHPAGLSWTHLTNSPLTLTTEEFNSVVDPQQVKNEQGRYIKPENVEGDDFQTMAGVKDQLPDLRLPAVWFPYGIHGISTSEPLKIPEGHFGTFEGQILIGDQGQSKIMRVFLEKVNGEYQGASIDFRSGFQSGVLRMAWAQDGSLFVGETNRGWGSAGEANQGLQRVVWNGNLPFEMRAVRAMPDGFEIEFTKPVDRKSAEDVASYSVNSYTYKYHPVYGSPPVNNEACTISGVKVSEDGMKARIIVEGLRPYYVHHIFLPGVRERDNFYSLVHPSAYYTLNSIPEGAKLSLGEVSTANSTVKNEKTEKTGQTTIAPQAEGTAKNQANPDEEVPTLETINSILARNTCSACHNPTTRQVGPSFEEIAKRNYENEQIVELIHTPKPENWPDYSTPMPPMPHVPTEDALKIAIWINSLNKQ